MEIKTEPFKSEAKKKEIRKMEGLNPDRLKYEILETKQALLPFDQITKVREAIYKWG